MEDLADIRWDLEDDGRLVRREVDRRVIEKGAWATALYLYEELDVETETWGPRKLALIRWRRVGGGWKKHAGFNVTDEDQAVMLRDALASWFSA